MASSMLLVGAVVAVVVVAVALVLVRRVVGGSVVEPVLFDPPPGPPPRQNAPAAPPSVAPTAAPLADAAAAFDTPPMLQISLAADQEEEIRAQLARGSKIGAIKLIRDWTDLGLAEAKRLVEEMERDAVAITRPQPDAKHMMQEQSMDVANDPEVQQALAKGSLIVAIKRVRELTGMGLKEAKEYAEALAAGQRPPTPARPSAAANGMDEVARLAASGNKIAAIKRYRELTGVGLREAKEYVDRLM